MKLQTLAEIVSKLPEVTLKAHDQNIVAFYHGYPYLEFAVNISNTRISPSVSRTTIKFNITKLGLQNFVQFFARVRISSFIPLEVRQSHLSHKRMIRLCRDHVDELNDTKKSVIRCHNHSAIIS